MILMIYSNFPSLFKNRHGIKKIFLQISDRAQYAAYLIATLPFVYNSIYLFLYEFYINLTGRNFLVSACCRNRPDNYFSAANLNNVHSCQCLGHGSYENASQNLDQNNSELESTYMRRSKIFHFPSSHSQIYLNFQINLEQIFLGSCNKTSFFFLFAQKILGFTITKVFRTSAKISVTGVTMRRIAK